MLPISGSVWRIGAIASAFAVAVGAFLTWGPIGIGPGPLGMGTGGGLIVQNEVRSDRPVGVIIPIANSGRAPAVIDRVQLLDQGVGYRGPHVLRFRTVANTICAPGGWTLRSANGPAVFGACPDATDLGPLIGRAIGFDPNADGVEAVAEVRPPAARACWALTGVAVDYHVGIRHYTAARPDYLSVCGLKADAAQVKAAFHAIGGLPA